MDGQLPAVTSVGIGNQDILIVTLLWILLDIALQSIRLRMWQSEIVKKTEQDKLRTKCMTKK